MSQMHLQVAILPGNSRWHWFYLSSGEAVIEEEEIVEYAKSIGGKYLIANLSERITTIEDASAFFYAVEGTQNDLAFT